MDFMGKDLFIIATIWFLIVALFIGGVFFSLSYHVEHYQSCWSCGKSVEKPNDYCTYCGAKMTPVCVNCGAECTTAFCGACGTPMYPEG